MATPTAHLIERAAERLRAESGLVDTGPPRPIERPENVSSDERQALFSPQTPYQTPAQSPRSDTFAPPAMGDLPSDVQPHDEHEDAHVSVSVASAGPVVGLTGIGSGSSAIATGSISDPPPTRMLDISTLERNGLVVGRKSRTRISEEFRIAVGHVLRTLQTSYTAGHGASNLILVTSSRPGEGKSFTALNLAGCIAQQDNRDVLLVDTDAKQRPITYELGLSDAPGLLDLVRNPSTRIEDVIVPTAIPSLSFLPIGARLTENAEMPLSRPITAVVERLARRFANRVIILDAPPCLSASDPSAFAPIVGQTVMVVEAERTQRNELEAALEMVRVCPTITLLLNKIQLTTSYTFGAYHYFGTYS